MHRPFERAVRTGPAEGSRDRGRAERPGLPVVVTQMLLVAAAALAYFAVRGVTEADAPRAFDNARTLIDLERALGVAWEESIQAPVLRHDLLLEAVNAVYIYGHWPVVGGVLVALFVWAPDRFYLLRNALFASGAIGLVIFWLIPVAPPRFGLLDVADTVSDHAATYRTVQPPSLVNVYAALPSLHLGWNLLVGVVLWGSTRHPVVRTFAAVTPPAMAVAVVATGNHYVLDVPAGAAVALAGLLIAHRLPAWRRTPDWARPRRR